jgi:trimethylamine--corrinoid protein Co-methyltransferase
VSGFHDGDAEVRLNIGQYKLLSEEAIQHIDTAARLVLERVGVNVLDPRTLELLAREGARVDGSARRARFDRGVLAELLARAPGSFTLHARDGSRDLHLGTGEVYFGNGGRTFRHIDTATGEHRPTVLQDVANVATLIQHLENIDFCLIPCQAHDVRTDDYHLNDFLAAFDHTTKPVMGGVDDLNGASQLVEMASMIAGDREALAERPFVSIMVNPVSPLCFNEIPLAVLRFFVEQGLPVACAPAPIAGATAPVTLAGTLAQMHAEALAGVAISQVFASGARVLYGAVPAVMDMRKMNLAIGSIEAALLDAAAVQLARHVGLPIYATAGLTESKTSDFQAGVEKTFSLTLTAMAGADYIHLSAGILDSGNAIAYEQYVLDDELIGSVRRLLAGVDVSDETLALDTIEAVGPEGNYVMEDHTFEHMMSELYYPRTVVRSNFDVWEGEGRTTMADQARQVVEDILAQHSEGLVEGEVRARIERRFEGQLHPLNLGRG